MCPLSLHLERVVAAAPAQVFAAFVDRESLAEWWGPAGFTAPSVELDVREGGSYRVLMQPPEGDPFHLRGEFVEIDPPRRLVLTFEWEEPDPDDVANVVTVDLVRVGAGTKVIVEQAPFATEARRELHEGGWTDTLERLAESLARRAS